MSQFDTSETLVEEADYRQCSASDISSRALNVDGTFLNWRLREATVRVRVSSEPMKIGPIYGPDVGV